MNELLQKFNFNCERCFDTGIWRDYSSNVGICPKIALREPHIAPNEASLILRQATNRLFVNKIWIHAFPFDLARILTKYDTSAPCPKQVVLDYFFADTELSEANKLRRFHGLIEELRNIWLLPVGSRKAEPSGYWIIQDVQDCTAWLNRAISAPKTQLATVWRCVKYNFPMLAGQQEFAFMNELETEANDVL